MGQLLQTVGAFMLLSLLTVTVNRSIVNSMQATYTSESIIASSTVAQAMLQEVLLKAFDQKTIPPNNGAGISSPSSMTAPLSLGPDAGESSAAQYNDIDDYNRYVRYDTIKGAMYSIFKDSVSVFYVSQNSPDTYSSIQTYYKKIMVIITRTDQSQNQAADTLSTIVTF